MGSARRDHPEMEIGIRTPDQGGAILPTISIPFPVSTRIHKFEDYVNELGPGKENQNYGWSRYRVFLKKRVGYGVMAKKFQVIFKDKQPVYHISYRFFPGW
jgi:hypothetical protein